MQALQGLLILIVGIIIFIAWLGIQIFIYFVLPLLIFVVILYMLGFTEEEVDNLFERIKTAILGTLMAMIGLLILSGIISYSLGWGDWIANLHECGAVFCK